MQDLRANNLTIVIASEAKQSQPTVFSRACVVSPIMYATRCVIPVVKSPKDYQTDRNFNKVLSVE